MGWVKIPVFILLATMTGGGIAIAQTVPERNAEYERRQDERQHAQREQQIEQIRERQRASPAPIESLPEPTVATTAETADTCHVFRQIRWQSMLAQADQSAAPTRVQTVLTQLELKTQELFNQWRPDCVQIKDLIELQNSLTRWLMTEGYTTSRISIPDQNIHSGILTLQFEPSTVAQIQSAPNHTGAMAMLMPNMEGNIYRQQDADQALENLKRLPSQANAHLELSPAEQNHGSILTYQRPVVGFEDRIHGSIGIDNSGTQGQGRAQVNGSLTIDAPLQLFDMLTLNVGSDTHWVRNNAKNRHYGLYWDVPMGYFGLQLGATRNDSLYTIGHNNRYTGNTDDYYINLAYVGYRDNNTVGTFNIRLSQKITQNYGNGEALEIQHKNYYYGQIGWNHRYYRGQERYDANFGYTFGLPNASHDIGYILDQPDWNGHFHVLNLGLSAYTPWQWKRQALYYQGALKAQYANHPVPDAELFSIGSRYTVRGTDETNSLADESGIYLRNQLGWQWGRKQIYFGIDGGVVFGASSRNWDKHALIGTVIGIKGMFRTIGYELTAGYPVYYPELMKPKHPAMTINIERTF